MNRKVKMTLLNAAMAGMIAGAGGTATGAQAAPPGTAQNGCSGKSGCGAKKTAAPSDAPSADRHACKGMNSCKGQGWLPEKSAAACEAKGGKIAEM